MRLSLADGQTGSSMKNNIEELPITYPLYAFLAIVAIGTIAVMVIANLIRQL
jgi:hypothetical protein